MKILVNYDEITGVLSDNQGATIGTWHGLETHEAEETRSKKTVVELIGLGVQPDDLIKLRATGLI